MFRDLWKSAIYFQGDRKQANTHWVFLSGSRELRPHPPSSQVGPPCWKVATVAGTIGELKNVLLQDIKQSKVLLL